MNHLRFSLLLILLSVCLIHLRLRQWIYRSFSKEYDARWNPFASVFLRVVSMDRKVYARIIMEYCLVWRLQQIWKQNSLRRGLSVLYSVLHYLLLEPLTLQNTFVRMYPETIKSLPAGNASSHE